MTTESNNIRGDVRRDHATPPTADPAVASRLRTTTARSHGERQMGVAVGGVDRRATPRSASRENWISPSLVPADAKPTSPERTVSGTLLTTGGQTADNGRTSAIVPNVSGP